MELFKINAFVITVMKCTSQHLQINGDVIFPKGSWATHWFIWFRVRLMLMDYTHQTVNHMTNFVIPWCEFTFKSLNLSGICTKCRINATVEYIVEKWSFYANTQWHEWISSSSVTNKRFIFVWFFGRQGYFLFGGALLQKIPLFTSALVRSLSWVMGVLFMTWASIDWQSPFC